MHLGQKLKKKLTVQKMENERFFFPTLQVFHTKAHTLPMFPAIFFKQAQWKTLFPQRETYGLA